MQNGTPATGEDQLLGDLCLATELRPWTGHVTQRQHQQQQQHDAPVAGSRTPSAAGPGTAREQQQVSRVSVPPSTSPGPNASVADNRCTCGLSQETLSYFLWSGERSSRMDALKMVLSPDDATVLRVCDTMFEADWRRAYVPKCAKGHRPLSEHPLSRSVEQTCTTCTQVALLSGQLLLSTGLGLYLGEESGETGSGVATLKYTLCTAAFSMMTVASLKHLVELVRAFTLQWPNLVRYGVVACLPLMISAACIGVAIPKESGVLFALACSSSGVYLSELMSAVAAWKRQRIDRITPDADIARLLNAAPRSAAVLALGSATPVLLVVPLWVLSGASSAQKYLFVLGLVLWALPIMYVLLELMAWHSFVPKQSNQLGRVGGEA